MAEVSKQDRLDHAARVCRAKAGSVSERLGELVNALGYLAQQERNASQYCADRIEKKLLHLELEKCRLIVERCRSRAVQSQAALAQSWAELEGELDMAELLAVCPDGE